MTLPPLLDRLLSVAHRVSTRVFVPLAPLLTRLVIGHAFFLTGRGKWRNFDNTVTFFTSLGIPFPTASAALVSTVELVGGICLMLGLGTRLAAALLSATMVVALMTADNASFVAALTGNGEQGLTDVVPLVFLMLLIWLIGYGAGPISLDRLVARKLAPRAAAAPSS